MTNPNNAIGTNAAFNGRTSPNALNDIAASLTSGIVSGWTCAPKAGMTVQLGGSASVRDVALAEDNAGDKLTINNRSGAPVEVTLSGAPATNNRIDAIVAYVDNPSTGDDTTTDNPSTCGIIAVSGTVAANPVAPNDTAIRAAITTDGATGGVAYYVVLATILVGTNVTTIGSGVITQGDASQSLAGIADGSVTTAKLADGAVTSQKVDWTTIEESIYHSDSGTSGNFTLDKSVDNYDEVKIYFHPDDAGKPQGCAIARKGHYERISLMVTRAFGGGSPYACVWMSTLTLSGTSATRPDGTLRWNSTWGTSNINANSSSPIYIDEIIGIKHSD